MPALDLDLTPLKTQLTSSISNLTSIGSGLNSAVSSVTGQVSGILDKVPSLGQLQNLIPTAVQGMTDSLKKVGDSILGTSAAALPSMTNLLNGLTPSLSGIKDLASSAVSGLKSLVGVDTSAVQGLCTAASAEADKVQTATVAVTSQVAAANTQGPVPIQQILTEVKTAATQLSMYKTQLSAWLFDSTSNPYPNVNTIVGAIGADATTTWSNNNKNGAVDLASGTISSAAKKVAGMFREVGMRMTNKTALYNQGQGDSSDSGDRISGEVGLTVSRIMSKSPEQTRGS